MKWMKPQAGENDEDSEVAISKRKTKYEIQDERFQEKMRESPEGLLRWLRNSV